MVASILPIEPSYRTWKYVLEQHLPPFLDRGPDNRGEKNSGSVYLFSYLLALFFGVFFLRQGLAYEAPGKLTLIGLKLLAILLHQPPKCRGTDLNVMSGQTTLTPSASLPFSIKGNDNLALI